MHGTPRAAGQSKSIPMITRDLICISYPDCQTAADKSKKSQSKQSNQSNQSNQPKQGTLNPYHGALTFQQYQDSFFNPAVAFVTIPFRDDEVF